MTTETTKRQGALGTLVCIYALMIILPAMLVAQCVIELLKLASDAFSDLAEQLDKSCRWALSKAPRLDRHDRI